MTHLLRGCLVAAAALAAGCASRGDTRPAARETLLVGVAAADITPRAPIRLTGYGNRTTPTSDVRQPLRAKALAFGGGRDAAVLITADLIGVPRALSDALAARLADAGVTRERLAVAATHTHTGPSLAGVLPYIFTAPVSAAERTAIEAYTAELTNTLEQVARRALADRRPARVGWTTGTARFAAQRRVIKDGKWTAFGVDPAGPVDHDLPVLTVRGADDTLRGVLVGYACHATTLEGRDNFVHGDWPGAAQQFIEARHPGAIALVAIGAGADANPRPRGGGIPDVERHAREVADEVDRLLAAPMRPVAAAPSGRFRELTLPLARVPDRSGWEAQARRGEPDASFARDILARLAGTGTIPAAAPYPVQAWTFGTDLAMVFLAGEVVSEYSLRLKRELDGARLWVTAYANDVSFYVASRRMIPEGGYEVERSMTYYGQPGILAEATEDLIVSAVKGMVPDAFARPAPRAGVTSHP